MDCIESPTCRFLRMSLQDLMVFSVAHRRYLPEGELATVLSKPKIHSLLSEDPSVDPEELLQRVDEVHCKASKILATLILTESTQLLAKHFLDKGLYDERLPLDERDLDLVALGERRAKKILNEQYAFLAPVFFKGVSYDSLDSRYILPFIVDEFQGEGAFGIVYKIEIHPKHQWLQLPSDVGFRGGLFARKEFKVIGDYRGNYEKEKRILQQLRKMEHPNILPLLATYSHENNLNIVFPLADMSLHEFLRSDDKPTTRALFRRVYNLTKALHHLHNPTFEDGERVLQLQGYHHDLKPQNILVQNGEFMIADFGLANFKDVDQTSKTPRKTGTGAYSPPEAGDGGVGRAYDIWMFGCILAEIVAFDSKGKIGVEEFAKCRDTQVTERKRNDCFHDGYKVKQEVLQYFQDLISADQLEGICTQVVRLVKEMLEPDVAKRPVSKYVLEKVAKILNTPDQPSPAAAASTQSSFEPSSTHRLKSCSLTPPLSLSLTLPSPACGVPISQKNQLSVEGVVTAPNENPAAADPNCVATLLNPRSYPGNINTASVGERFRPDMGDIQALEIVQEESSEFMSTLNSPSTASPNQSFLEPKTTKQPKKLLRFIHFLLSPRKLLKAFFKHLANLGKTTPAKNQP